MSTELLHNQAGDWIAFRVDDRYVYSPDGTIVGWCLDGQPDVVVDQNGQYLGEVVDGNRLFRRTERPFMPSTSMSNPGGTGVPSDPGNIGYASLPSGMEEVPKDLFPGA